MGRHEAKGHQEKPSQSAKEWAKKIPFRQWLISKPALRDNIYENVNGFAVEYLGPGETSFISDIKPNIILKSLQQKQSIPLNERLERIQHQLRSGIFWNSVEKLLDYTRLYIPTTITDPDSQILVFHRDQGEEEFNKSRFPTTKVSKDLKSGQITMRDEGRILAIAPLAYHLNPQESHEGLITDVILVPNWKNVDRCINNIEALIRAMNLHNFHEQTILTGFILDKPQIEDSAKHVERSFNSLKAKLYKEGYKVNNFSIRLLSLPLGEAIEQKTQEVMSQVKSLSPDFFKSIPPTQVETSIIPSTEIKQEGRRQKRKQKD